MMYLNEYQSVKVQVQVQIVFLLERKDQDRIGGR